LDTVRELAALEQPANAGPEMGALAVFERLLRQPEPARTAPPDLDHDQPGRRSRIDGHDVQLAPAGMNVPGQDPPATCRQTLGDQGFGRVAGSLLVGPLHDTSNGGLAT
jgi:hypothetical protein